MNYRKQLSGSAAYRSAVPESIFNMQFVVDESMQQLIDDTEAALRHWSQQASSCSADEQRQMMEREAEISWMLSAGQTIDLFSPLWLPPIHSREDKEDISNLLRATLWAVEAMDELPVSRRLLCDAHYLMCRSGRYEKKYPGEFRTSPVWIGEIGRKLQDDDVFVPPVEDDMTDAFTDLERFIHYADEVHPLVRVALTHYQFETIHPFIDANGRIGRLLTQLQLMDYGYITAPLLPLSEQLSRHSIQYYFGIQKTHLDADYREWTRWFLMRMKKAAETKMFEK